MTDLALKSKVAYGMKISGYFPGAANWLGLKFEGFYNQPDIKAQTPTTFGSNFTMAPSLNVLAGVRTL